MNKSKVKVLKTILTDNEILLTRAVEDGYIKNSIAADSCSNCGSRPALLQINVSIVEVSGSFLFSTQMSDIKSPAILMKY